MCFLAVHISQWKSAENVIAIRFWRDKKASFCASGTTGRERKAVDPNQPNNTNIPGRGDLHLLANNCLVLSVLWLYLTITAVAVAAADCGLWKLDGRPLSTVEAGLLDWHHESAFLNSACLQAAYFKNPTSCSPASSTRGRKHHNNTSRKAHP